VAILVCAIGFEALAAPSTTGDQQAVDSMAYGYWAGGCGEHSALEARRQSGLFGAC